jgi:hypothetical protein
VVTSSMPARWGSPVRILAPNILAVARTYASARFRSLVGFQFVVWGEGADSSEGAEAAHTELPDGDLHGLALPDLVGLNDAFREGDDE